MNTAQDTYSIKHFQLNVRVDNTLTNDPAIMVDIRAIMYEDGFIAIDVPEVPMHKLVLVKSWLQVYTDANEVAKKIFADESKIMTDAQWNRLKDEVFASTDYEIADMEERLRPNIRVTMHEEIKVPSIAHNL